MNRYMHEGQGKILRLESGLVVVPYDRVSATSYYAVVVYCPPELEKFYPVGGYNIVIGERDVTESPEVALEQTPVDPDEDELLAWEQFELNDGYGDEE